MVYSVAASGATTTGSSAGVAASAAPAPPVRLFSKAATLGSALFYYNISTI